MSDKNNQKTIKKYNNCMNTLDTKLAKLYVEATIMTELTTEILQHYKKVLHDIGSTLYSSNAYWGMWQ